jgi:hypothetical protein
MLVLSILYIPYILCDTGLEVKVGAYGNNTSIRRYHDEG